MGCRRHRFGRRRGSTARTGPLSTHHTRRLQQLAEDRCCRPERSHRTQFGHKQSSRRAVGKLLMSVHMHRKYRHPELEG